MYEKYYGFSRRPFSLLPDPDFLYLSGDHREALSQLRKALASRSGGCLITGEVGAGKTTLKLKLLEAIGDRCQIGHIPNANAEFGRHPGWILQAFGLQPGGADANEAYAALMAFLRKTGRKRTILIIDEAQVLEVNALLALHGLLEVARNTDAGVQLILFGQIQLRETLAHPELSEFLSEIRIEHHLKGLDFDETRAYIEHRIRYADGDPSLFTDAAVKAIFQQSGGIPRIINVVCDTALVHGYMEASPVINSAIVTLVGSDREQAGLTEGMWQPPERVVMQTGETQFDTSDPESTVLDHATDWTIPDIPVDKEPAFNSATPMPVRLLDEDDNTLVEQRRSRGRLLDAISIVLIVILGVLVWIGRDQLFTNAPPTASTSPPAEADSADFASLRTKKSPE